MINIYSVLSILLSCLNDMLFYKNIFYNSFSFMLTSTCVTSDLYFGTLIIWINKLVSPGKVNTNAVFGLEERSGGEIMLSAFGSQMERRVFKLIYFYTLLTFHVRLYVRLFNLCI